MIDKTRKKETRTVSDLKKCPHCGSKARVYHNTNSDYESNWSWDVECVNEECTANVYTACGGTREEAIEMWNTRAPQAQGSNSLVIPEGWKLVPIEPTEDMMHSVYDNVSATYIDNEGNDLSDEVYREVYEFMLDGAPRPPESTKIKLERIESLIIEDILETPDDEIWQEVVEEHGSEEAALKECERLRGIVNELSSETGIPVSVLVQSIKERR